MRPGTGVADDKARLRVHARRHSLLSAARTHPYRSCPTHLCRRKEDLKFVLDHVDELVIKATNESGGYGMLIGPAATKEERETFAARVRENPAGYIAQPTLQLSRVPHLGRRSPRGPARRPSALHPLRRRDPGHSRGAHAGRAQEGLAGRQFFSRRRLQRHLGPRRPKACGGQVMLSRVAESVLLDEPLHRARRKRRPIRRRQPALHARLARRARSDQWDPTRGHHRGRRCGLRRGLRPRRDGNRCSAFLLFDRELSELRRVVPCAAAREKTRARVREVISVRHLRADQSRVPDGAGLRATARVPCCRIRRDFLRTIKEACHALLGTTLVSMSRNEAWHFMRVGRMVERADKTSRIVDVKYFLLLPSPSDVGSSVDELQWSALLRSASGLEMYRKRHGRIAPSHIVAFLLLDEAFPRSCQYCVELAQRSLHTIDADRRSPVARRIGKLSSELQFSEVNEIIDAGLHQWVDRLQTELNVVGQAIRGAVLRCDGRGLHGRPHIVAEPIADLAGGASDEARLDPTCKRRELVRHGRADPVAPDIPSPRRHGGVFACADERRRCVDRTTLHRDAAGHVGAAHD